MKTVKRLREELSNQYGLMSPEAYFKLWQEYEAALLTTLQIEVERLRMNEDQATIEFLEDEDVAERTLIRNRATNQAIDDVLAIINKLREGK